MTTRSRIRTLLLSSLLTIAASASFSADANACGGCFQPVAESTVVTGHRMAFAISQQQTVLWDQIEYSGSPSGFAWVLPIKKGARIEVGSNAWFEALDAATRTNVFGPPQNCFGGFEEGGSGCGCGMSDATAGGTGGDFVSDKDPVTVVKRETVGPYDALTLSTDVPGVLTMWLQSKGFALPNDIQPVIDAYVSEGFDFIALRLAPNQGVQNMQPVRVISPGASPILPLRMVAAGTGANTAITLYIIGEGRWEAKNAKNILPNPGEITWDYATTTSDFSEKRLGWFTAENGKAWLTSFAKPGPLLSPVTGGQFGFPVSYTVDKSSTAVNTIAELWVATGRSNVETLDSSCIDKILSYAGSSDTVIDTCHPNNGGGGGGGSGGSGGAGGAGGAGGGMPSCGMADFGQIDARDFNCTPVPNGSPFDDLGVALTGMHPSSVWVTRLEANLSRSALELDLELQAEAGQSAVDNWLQAGITKNNTCAGAALAPPNNGESAAERKTKKEIGALALLAIGIAAAAARRASRAMSRPFHAT